MRGVGLLCDFSGFTLGQMRAASSADIKRGIAMAQGTFPLRLGAVYIVCEPRWFSVVMSIITPLLNAKGAGRLQSRVVLCGSDYSRRLRRHVAASELPDEYGGTQGPLAHGWAEWVKAHAN